MPYSPHPSASGPVEPVGIRLTALALFCEDCRCNFHLVISGFLSRVNEIFLISEKNSAATVWAKLACPDCGGQKLWLWEII